MEFTTLGAVTDLVIAIILIIKKVHPAYSLILGALIGGLVGGGGLTGTVNTIISCSTCRTTCCYLCVFHLLRPAK